LLTAKA
jgi:hypothetical protein